jgi:hypothetical protein
MGEEIKTLQDLKRAYPALCEQIYDNLSSGIMDGLDEKIDARLAEITRQYQKRLKKKLAEQHERDLGVLRQILSMLTRWPGVIPGEENAGDEDDGDEPE